jgi:tetratricopeptide (TPR) repeat protein
LLVLVALLYTLVIGLLSTLRREGLSWQVAVEIVMAAAVLIGLSLAANRPMQPVLLVALLYLVTMRARLLVDLANLLARRGMVAPATRLYRLALGLKPDPISRLIAQLNQGVHMLKQNQITQAISQLQGLLPAFDTLSSPKYEAAVRYNLAVAYQRHGEDAKAVIEFNQVIDLMPGSLYSVGAQKALDRGKRKDG